MVSNRGQASLIGQQLGNYAVRALLGRGATGTVYLAKDTALGRLVALKVLLGSLARNPEQVERFLQEARAAAPLHHQNIVGVYEAGVREGVPFIAMEYVEGETLERFLRRNAPIPWQHAVDIAAQVGDALYCAHQGGVVHRDVKPANILLDRQGRARLTDFGIAGMQENQAQARTGNRFFGTPAYMSPEQCGMNGPISPQSDLFSLGVILYEMLSGKMPFAGHTTPALVHAIANETPLRLNSLNPSIPDDVARLVAFLLAKHPVERPASALEVRRIVARLQRENGGGSALPEALRAYLMELAEPVVVRAETPMPGELRAAAKGLRVRAEDKHFEPVSAFAKVGMALLLLLTLAGAGYWNYVEAPVQIGPAPVLVAAGVSPGAAGEVWVDLPGEHWLVESIHWAGADAVVLVTVAGRPGTPVHGSHGVLAITPDTGHVRNVASPTGPMTDPSAGAGGVDRYQVGMIPAMPPRQPFAGALIVPALMADVESDGGVLLAHRWDESKPRPKPLLRFSTGRPRGETPVVLHPGGETVCLVRHAHIDASDELVEYNASTGSVQVVAAGLHGLEPSSLQYSPTGRFLAYIVSPQPGRKELWVAEGGTAPSRAPYPLAIGALGDAAFHPAEQLVAVSRTEDGVSTVILVEMATGRIVDGPSPGRIGKESWMPDGSRLIVLDDASRDSGRQLWAMGAMPPFARAEVLPLAGGVEQVASVSRDGRWCATASTGPDGPAVVFVPMWGGGLI